MAQENWKEQCSQMSDRELVRAATIDREEFNEQFLEIIAGELRDRNIDLAGVAEPVKLRFNDQVERALAIEEALAELKRELTARDSWSLTNYLEETLVIQKDAAGFLLHYYFEEQYHNSFLLNSFDTLAQTVRQFCRFEDWYENIEHDFYLDDWSVLVSSPSRDYIDIIAAALDKSGVRHIVRGSSPGWAEWIPMGRGSSSSLNILIPREQGGAAERVLDEIEKTIEALHRQADALAEKGDLPKELEVYNYLAKLQPDDEVVFFNRALILFDLERYPEAASSFIQAVINGIAAKHLAVVEDSKTYLQEILQKIPPEPEILHTLASFSLEEEQPAEAEKYYRMILDLKPGDEIAHLNLGYLCYRDERRNHQALQHFREYLKLKPGAEDWEAVEAIIKEIE
ncbi:MAG: hypothetical protein HUU32_06495 [Calditrichaceae bacterium]|nr:hypothetical protein [Calditrichia bacterium]NUQ41028.1 hypothetical protein [Calditrichaceae bacterium]